MITSRAVIGQFYQALQQFVGASWIDRASMYFPNADPLETYEWLGQVPGMRLWVGGRQPKELADNIYQIQNEKYETTIDMPVSWLKNDKTGQVNLRVSELAQRPIAHWAQLISTLILNGNSTTCYDGKNFFATNHANSQKNLVTKTTVPALQVTASTKPTATEAIDAILGTIAHLQSFVDDQKEPMNSEAKGFVVMAAPALWAYLVHATLGEIAAGGSSNVLKELSKQGYVIEAVPNPRLSAWTDMFVVLRTDALAKPFIRQEQEELTIASKDETSEYAFDYDRVQFGVKAVRAAGYGLWEYAVRAQLST